MNKRIRELAEQAGMWKVVHFPHLTPEEEQAIEKFAELIVRECAETAASCFVGWPMNGKEQRHICSIEIKKHFGVE